MFDMVNPVVPQLQNVCSLLAVQQLALCHGCGHEQEVGHTVCPHCSAA